MQYCSWMLYHSAGWLCEEHLLGKFTHIQQVNQPKPGDSSSAEYPSQLVFDCISPILFEAILLGEIICSFSFTKKKPLNHDIALTVSCWSVLRVQDAWFLKWSDAGVHQLQACGQLLLYVLLSIYMYTKKIEEKQKHELIKRHSFFWAMGPPLILPLYMAASLHCAKPVNQILWWDTILAQVRSMKYWICGITNLFKTLRP